MSCYLVSVNHLSAIIGYACRENLKAGWISNPGRYAYQSGQEQSAFDALYHANLQSVQARYPSTAADASESRPIYYPCAPKLRAIEVIKACDGYLYQCDEWSDFQGSEAQLIVHGIREHAIRQLPGYAAAEWSID